MKSRVINLTQQGEVFMQRQCYGDYPSSMGIMCLICGDKKYCQLESNGNTVHELKCWPEFYEEIHKNTKNFEVRLNDRDFKVGDILHLKEFNPMNNKYTGREIQRTITYILSDENFVKEGTVIMSICRSF